MDVPDLSGVGPADVARWLVSAEAAAESDPDPARSAVLVAQLDDLSAVFEEPFAPPVRRGALVRWDASTTTWLATDVDGAPITLRVLRPSAARRPALVRAFRREVAALRRVLPVAPGELHVSLRLVGWPVDRLQGEVLARSLGSALADLERWAAEGLAPAAPASEELRIDAGGGVYFACLTLASSPASAVAATFSRIDADDDGPVAEALRARPQSLDEARRWWIRAMAAELASRRHALVDRWRSGRHADRRGRLLAQVERLQTAIPAPKGLGAVGVDLDGRITVVRSDGRAVVFGPAEAPEVVWEPADGFRPVTVRRLLRARAVSPPNPVLDARIGGDPAHTDALCAWVASGLRLRTLRKLLEVAP